MGIIVKILGYLCLCAGVQCVHRMSWLPCRFTDEHVTVNSDGHVETQHLHREAALQFGQAGDTALNPHVVTFLITGSKLDLRRFTKGAEADELDCELRRYSTSGLSTYWPAQGEEGYNRWFSCTLKHADGPFTVTGFLRHLSDQQPPGQQDYHSWPAIKDGETLTTSVAIVIKTLSTSVKAALGSQQILHCQFAIDHRGPNVTVEWHQQHRGERTRLFSHNPRMGRSEGAGVRLRGLEGGNASYSLPYAKMTSEGTYICSVSVLQVLVSLDISLTIEEPPRVSLNIGPTLLLQEGGEQKVSCSAEGYYPLDVEMVWQVQDTATVGKRVGAPLPKELQNVLLSSHKLNQDKTYSLVAFFYLQASLRDSGMQYTCSVSHQSLRVPIKKSFILTVEEPSSWMSNLVLGFIVIVLLVVLFNLLRYLNSERNKVQKKPY